MSAPKQAAAPACPLPGQGRYTIAQIFFGRDIAGRGPLTDAEWDAFAARAITPQFPDGFTVMDGTGQWYDQASGKLIHEPSKILLVVADPESDLRTRIGSVINAYRAQFKQRSVGVITSEACAAF
ncbi:MAG TPA: DUF3574 domain-containing protein [Stellaceae bacterium]